LQRPADRIRYWNKHGIEGMSNESIFGTGAMGIAWYVSSRLLWDPQADVSALLKEFYERCFGPAAPVMKRMLERWSDGFTLATHELALSYRDLQEARRLAAADPLILSRIDDFATYVRYLQLWYEYQETKTASPERAAAARDLVTWIWRTYASGMVSSFRMYQLITARYEKDAGLAKDFDPKDAGAAGWASGTPPTSAEVAQFITDGIAKFQPLAFEARKYSGDLVPLTAGGAPGEFSKPLMVGSTAEFDFEASPEVKSLPLKIKVFNKPTAHPDKVQVFNTEGQSIFDQALPANGEERDISISLPKPGRYHLRVFDQKTIFSIQAPDLVPLVTSGFTSPGLSERLYFYVPKGLRKIALYAPGAIPLKIWDGSGKPVTYQGTKLIVVDVPEGQDGRAWSCAGYKSYTPIRCLNVPQSFAFFADTLLVPKECLVEASR
jgi:hypothetical protein